MELEYPAPMVKLGVFHPYAELLLMAEIWRSPVEVGSLYLYLQGFIHPRWLGMGFLNHQQYGGKTVISTYPLHEVSPPITF